MMTTFAANASLFRSMRLAWAVGMASLTAAGGAQAQAQPPTTTDLGIDTLCRTSTAGQGCHELHLTTAARFNSNGVRNGTTGTLTLRNLQGSVYTAPNGQS